MATLPPIGSGTAALAVFDAAGNILPTGTTLEPGATLRVQSAGFDPDEVVAVTVHSVPRSLTPAIANGAGVVSYRLMVPFDLEAGQHRLEFAGAHLTASYSFTVANPKPQVAPPPAAGGATRSKTLPFTGGPDPLQPLALAVVLLWAGALLIVHGRRGVLRPAHGKHRR